MRIYQNLHQRPKTRSHGQYQKKLNRRQAIEPHIGHMKNEYKLGLSRLKGLAGDLANAILTSTRHKNVLDF